MILYKIKFKFTKCTLKSKLDDVPFLEQIVVIIITLEVDLPEAGGEKESQLLKLLQII